MQNYRCLNSKREPSLLIMNRFPLSDLQGKSLIRLTSEELPRGRKLTEHTDRLSNETEF